MSYNESWREVKACEGCGFTRLVLVRDWGCANSPNLWWVKRCGACVAEQRAQQLAAQARRFMAKASEIRAKRQISADRAKVST